MSGPLLSPGAHSAVDHDHQRTVLRTIIGAYDSPIVRAYCYVRFVIININMLHIALPNSAAHFAKSGD